MNNEEFVERRKNRCIASLLSAKERDIDRYLPSDVAAGYRKLILDEINDFALLVIDLLEDNINEEFLIMLEEMHSVIVKEE